MAQYLQCMQRAVASSTAAHYIPTPTQLVGCMIARAGCTARPAQTEQSNTQQVLTRISVRQ